MPETEQLHTSVSKISAQSEYALHQSVDHVKKQLEQAGYKIETMSFTIYESLFWPVYRCKITATKWITDSGE